MVSRHGRAARGRGRAGRDRARHHGDGPAARALLPGVAPAFRSGVRGPHGPGRPHRGGSHVSTVKIPMPLRVPELAPSLGRVVVPRRVAEPWVPIDDIREALATPVLELADEERRWGPEIEALERWRPSLWPVFVLWAPLAAALLWLGLVLGGYVPAPLWLAARLGF